jgi:hypothetical protein
MIQGSSEDSSSSKGPSITIEHITSSLLSTTKVSQTSIDKGTFDKHPSLFFKHLDIKRKKK